MKTIGLSHLSLSAMKSFAGIAAFILLGASPILTSGAEPPAPQPNSAYVDAEGQTHLTRVVPVPATISLEAQAMLTKPQPSILSSAMSIIEQRAKMDARQAKDAEAGRRIYPATVSEAIIAGVPVHLVTPPEIGAGKSDRVLINLHGGGFRTDAGSLLETIPIANLTRTKVVAVLYRLAPENPFPAALDDAVAVYRELLKTYRPEKIGIYGTSAGAILTAETAVKIKELGLPLPAVLGIFSALGDFSKAGDTWSLFSIQGLTGTVAPRSSGALLPDYVGKTDPTNPVLSPLYADLHGMPPTLFVTSTRDMLLSGTVLLHQAFLRAGIDARLAVLEALPHAAWLDLRLPESRAAHEMMAQFFDDHLGK